MFDDEDAVKYGDILREFYAEMDKRDLPLDQLLDFYGEELLVDMPKNIRGDCVKISDFNEKDWKCLIAANTKSGTMLSYGVKGSIAKEKSTHMSWSNGSRCWYTHSPVQEGQSIRLDANEMLIPCSPKRADRIRCYINELPLYYSSTEAKMRGEVTAEESLSIYTEGKLGHIIDKLPKEMADDLKDKIREKGWGFFFDKG